MAKYQISFKNMYGNSEVTIIDASEFEMNDGVACFYRKDSENSFPELFAAFKDVIHVVELPTQPAPLPPMPTPTLDIAPDHAPEAK